MKRELVECCELFRDRRTACCGVKSEKRRREGSIHKIEE
jgi:hypothetical protein